MKKTEPEKIIQIKTFDDLQTSLRPFIEKVIEAKKKITNLQRGLSEYQTKFEAIEKKVTSLVKEAGQTVGEGKIFEASDVLLATKRQKEDLEGWISQVQDEMLPQAQGAMGDAIKELRSKILEGIDLVESSYVERVQGLYDEIEAVKNEYVTRAQGLIKEHGITLASYEAIRIYTLFSPIKKGY